MFDARGGTVGPDDDRLSRIVNDDNARSGLFCHYNKDTMLDVFVGDRLVI